KRAMRKRPQVNMEWALLADGVPPAQVYDVLATPEGQQRAFDKLDSIRKDLVWFDSWSQAPQLLNDGGAVLVQSANGRFYDSIRQENKPFVIVWDGHVYDLDAWAIVKGSPKKELALKFIAYATGSKPLAGMPDIAYGPTRKSSMPLADQSAAPHLPTAHLEQGVQAGSGLWADYGDSLGERFSEWRLRESMPSRSALLHARSAGEARQAAAVRRRKRLLAFVFVLPLLLFILVSFVGPIGSMLWRSLYHPAVAEMIPATLELLREWDGQGLPSEATLTRFATELSVLNRERQSGRLDEELNRAYAGMSSVVKATARRIGRLDDAQLDSEGAATLLEAHPNWRRTEVWRAIERAGRVYTYDYYLTALDL